MNARERAAGVVCVGFDGYELPAGIRNRLPELPLGGLILFGRNVRTLRQTRALTDEIRAAYAGALKPLVAIDQEGGRVARLREGVEELPSMMALAATGDERLARDAGEQLAFDLRRAGINVDFAPVLDLALFAQNTVIGARSFGDDPERVARFAGAFADGMRLQGIVPTFKHFPGHGSTAVDSHLNLPTIDLDEALLRSRDVMPFAKLLPTAEAVMTAHIVTRAFDPDVPATLSRRLLTGVLRDEIGFGGVCFTDCLQMEAIAGSYGVARGAVLAIAAGADCVLISHSMDLAETAVDAIDKAVADGTISGERLSEAHARMVRLRERLAEPLPLDAQAPHPGVGRRIGRLAVTRVRGQTRLDPGAAVVLSFEGTTTEGVQGTHSLHHTLGGGDVPQVRLPLDPSASEIEDALARLEGLHRRPIVLARRAHVYAGQSSAIERVLARFPDAVLVSAREPFDAFAFPVARNVTCIYGDDAPSIAGLEDVFFGGQEARGTLPLSLVAS